MRATLTFVRNSVFDVVPLTAGFRIDSGELSVGMRLYIPISDELVFLGRVTRIQTGRRLENIDDVESIESGNAVVVTIDTSRVMDWSLDAQLRAYGLVATE
jgi:hypothetical protein